MCTRREHFTENALIDTDDGFHHYGPELAIPTSDRMLLSGPETVVKVILKAWTPRLDADPGPGRIELQLATTEQTPTRSLSSPPDEARAISTALLRLADIAERAIAE